MGSDSAYGESFFGEPADEIATLRERLAAAESSLSRAVEALRETRRRVPAHHEGDYFIEHFGPDGEYLGSESVNPADIIASIVGALDAVLAEVGK